LNKKELSGKSKFLIRSIGQIWILLYIFEGLDVIQYAKLIVLYGIENVILFIQQEIILRKPPFAMHELSSEEVIERVKKLYLR